jgi:Zn-dependent peptidase ImmA (M78 family)
MPIVGSPAARRRAQLLLLRHGISAAPVPVERLVKAEGAMLQYAPLDDELSGMAFEKGGVAVIAVNALHHPNRQRFTIAHELAHVLLHREVISGQVHVDKEFRVRPDLVLNRDQLAASGTDPREMEANAFASELLMPKDWVQREIEDGWNIDDDEKIASLARKFRVSVAAMQFRLVDLR